MVLLVYRIESGMYRVPHDWNAPEDRAGACATLYRSI